MTPFVSNNISGYASNMGVFGNSNTTVPLSTTQPSQPIFNLFGTSGGNSLMMLMMLNLLQQTNKYSSTGSNQFNMSGKWMEGSGISKKVIDTALGERGVKQDDGSYLKYGCKGHWCAAYASWVYKNALGACPWGTKFSCANIKEWAVEKGVYKSSPTIDDLQPGDSVIWRPGTNSKGRSHIAIVQSVNRETGEVITINGNSNCQVRTKTHNIKTAEFDGVVKIGAAIQQTNGFSAKA